MCYTECKLIKVKRSLVVSLSQGLELVMLLFYLPMPFYFVQLVTWPESMPYMCPSGVLFSLFDR